MTINVFYHNHQWKRIGFIKYFSYIAKINANSLKRKKHHGVFTLDFKHIYIAFYRFLHRHIISKYIIRFVHNFTFVYQKMWLYPNWVIICSNTRTETELVPMTFPFWNLSNISIWSRSPFHIVHPCGRLKSKWRAS